MRPMLVDTHAHLTDASYAEDLPDVVRRAREAGVGGFIVVGYDVGTSDAAVALAASIPGAWATVGIHPNHAGEAGDATLARVEALAASPGVVAIGECGLDFFHMRAPPGAQREAFKAQVAIASRLGLPLVVHSRDAMAETLALLEESPPARGGVLHCFDGSPDDAARAVALGMAISVAGPITYRKDPSLARAVASVPLDRLMVETDCPYLGPAGFRGRRNEPARVVLVAEAVARARSIGYAEVAAATTRTACRTFGIEVASDGSPCPADERSGGLC